MSWIIKDKFVGYFGSIHDDLYFQNEYDQRQFTNLGEKIEKRLSKCITAIFFLKQIHTARVIVVDQMKDFQKKLDLFNEKGDAIITNQRNIAIGVVTADCLPLFLYDPVHQAIGVIHAGWRGLASKIITETILEMQNHFQTNPEKLQVFLGPSAGICCYEVQDDFLSHFPSTTLREGIIEKRKNKYYFNPGKAAITELLHNQIASDSIDSSQNICTICDTQFCSVRRQKENAGRQPSIALLL